ncbi:MAG: hypothetical protein ABUS79_17130 [Pseudomonadota bacterium]
MTADPSDTVRKIRRAAAVGGMGLAVQLGAALHWTPLTFVLSAAIGVPLVLAGGALFLSAVWRTMRDKGAL